MPSPSQEPGTDRVQELRYLAFGRVVPGVLFGLLGWLQIHGLESDWGRAARMSWDQIVGGPVRGTFYTLFCLLPVCIYIVRPRPQGRDGSAGARAVAFGGTLVLLLAGAYSPTGPQLLVLPQWVAVVAAVVVAAASAGSVWVLLTLRTSFSIIPEARHLVTTGPYRLLRHPMYACEIASAMAITLPGMHVLSILALCAFVLFQVARIIYEERLLRRTFPGWVVWASERARLLPGVY